MNTVQKLTTTLLILILSGCQPSGDDANWTLYGNGYHNQRYSKLNQINDNNVHKLSLAWQYQTGKKATFQTSPIVIDGIMYITTPYNDVIAINAQTGKTIWRYHHKLNTDRYCCGPANRGPAISGDKILTVTIDARLIALDRHNGQVLWDTKIVDPNAGQAEVLQSIASVSEFTGATQTGQTGYSANLAPQVYGDKIFVGITGAGYGLHLEQDKDGKTVLSVGSFSGGGHGLRGFLVAFDVNSGEEIWRWYSIPDQNWEGDWTTKLDYGVTLNRNIEKEKATQNQYQNNWKLGGGSVYTTPAIDPELGLLYVGTGNPSPQMDATTRPGDNLYTVSLVALDIETGKLRWHYQQVPHDRWGYDVASPPVLFDYHDNGKVIKAVGQASKLGWFFIHDRITGKLIKRSEPFIPQENLFALPSHTGTRIVPGTLGASSWSPVALDPTKQLVYITGIYQPSLFINRNLTPSEDKPWESYTFFQPTDEPNWGNVSAISTTNGKIVWQYKTNEPMVGGALVTAGNVVFTGEGNGYFNALNAQSGKLLWRYLADYGVNAPPITYAIDGKQYITVAAGGNRLFGYTTGDVILTFTLDK